MQSKNQGGSALRILLRIPGISLPLGDQTARRTGNDEDQQKNDGKAHGGYEIPDFFQCIHNLIIKAGSGKCCRILPKNDFLRKFFIFC